MKKPKIKFLTLLILIILVWAVAHYYNYQKPPLLLTASSVLIAGLWLVFLNYHLPLFKGLYEAGTILITIFASTIATYMCIITCGVHPEWLAWLIVSFALGCLFTSFSMFCAQLQ